MNPARAAFPSRRPEAADITVDDRFTPEVGGERRELIYPRPSHGPGNHVIHIPDADVMKAVDPISPGWRVWRRLALAGDVLGYISAR